MKVYIIGNKGNIEDFNKADEYIRGCGDTPINMTKILSFLDDFNLSDQIAICYELIRISDAVYCTGNDKGNFMAAMERAKAEKDNKEIYE